MALLGGNKKGQIARPQAKDVKARVQGGGQVNLARLKALKEQHSSRGEFYKLQQNGISRFRIVLPLGNDDIPMAIADQHFLPIIDDTGKQSRRSIYCLNNFGLDCPICRLAAMLQNSNDAGLIEDGDKIRVASRWAMWVINRDYLASSNTDDPMADHDPRKDKVAMLSVPKSVGEGIIEYMQKRVWSDPQDPAEGYDFEVEGKKKGGASPWPEYTLTPQPREASPAYDTNLLKGVKPLSQTIVPAKVEDIDKILTPILMSLAESGDDGAYIVEEFSGLWDEFKETNKDGILVPESVRDSDPSIDEETTPEEAEAYVEETAAAPVARPAAKAPVARPAAKAVARPAAPAKPQPVEEDDNAEAGEFEEETTEEGGYYDEGEEGNGAAPEGSDAESEGDESPEDTEEDAGDTEPVEEEPKQPVARPAAPRPAAKAPAAPAPRPAIPRPNPAAAPVVRPAAPKAPAAPAAPANSMKARLASIGR